MIRATAHYTITELFDGEDGNPGADAYTVFLTSEAHNYQADENGNASDLTPGRSQVRVYRGTAQFTSSHNTIGSPSEDNRYRISGISVLSGQMTYELALVSNQVEFRPLTFTSDHAVVQISVRARFAGVNTTFVKLMSYTKARKGQTGPPGQDANMLDWVTQWNSGKTQIGGDSVVTPKLFAGVNAGTAQNPNITGVAMGDILGDGYAGLAGYYQNKRKFYLDPQTGEMIATAGVFQGLVGTTANVDYYVSTSGNDANPGTPSLPFRTIQHAINQIPFQVNHTISIKVVGGQTFTENLLIDKITAGKGLIDISPVSGTATINGIIDVQECSCNFNLSNLVIGVQSGSSFYALRVSDTPRIDATQCLFRNAVYGAYLTRTKAEVLLCQVTNVDVAVYCHQHTQLLSIAWGTSRQCNKNALTVFSGSSLIQTGAQPIPGGGWTNVLHGESHIASVIESNVFDGGSPNGYYIRYSDGTQICWGRYDVSISWSAEGSIFISGILPNQEFPAAFMSGGGNLPSVYAHCSLGESWAAAMRSVSPTSFNPRFYAGRSISTGTRWVAWSAIGRWR